MARRVLVGAVVEFALSRGYIYGICTHDLKDKGQVLRLYKDYYSQRLVDPMTTLDTADFRITIKFPLKYVLKEPELRIVGQRTLTTVESVQPTFRSLGLFPQGGKAKGWWIIESDAATATWVTALTEAMVDFPDDGLYNLAAIEDLYIRDLYSHSPELLQRGPLAFSLSQVR